MGVEKILEFHRKTIQSEAFFRSDALTRLLPFRGCFPGPSNYEEGKILVILSLIM